MNGRKVVAERMAWIMMIVLVMAIAIVISLIIAFYKNNNCHTRQVDLDTREEQEKTELNVDVEEKRTIPEKSFTFYNADGSLDEDVKISSLIGRTRFTDGCYQISLTIDEIKLLQAYVFAESGTTEGLVGQVAVAAEVINRIRDERFPNTLYEVLSQEGQYYEDGIPCWYDEEGDWRPVYESDVTDKVKFAVELALEGCDPTEKYFEGDGALYHYSPRFTEDDSQKNNPTQISIGNHNFYRDYK